MMMRFESRQLNPFAEPVSGADLAKGSIYFSVNYADDEMLMPSLEPVVFLGRDVDPQFSGVYFQDLESHARGIRYEGQKDDSTATFYVGSDSETKHIFTYEHALEELMRCALRRNQTLSTK